MIPGKNGRVRKVARPAAGEPVVASGGAANSAESRYNLEGKPANSGITIPTLLTLVRVAAVPALVSVYYIDAAWAAYASFLIFVLAAATDWLDGYLARKMKLTSAFGAFLDPVADKLMVAAALVLLSAHPPHAGFAAKLPWLVSVPSVVIIGRELTMSAFREWASAAGGDAHKAVAVNNLGKWKTATQMIAISLLLLTRDNAAGPLFGLLSLAGPLLLWVSAFLAALSLWVYMSAGLPHLMK